MPRPRTARGVVWLVPMSAALLLACGDDAAPADAGSQAGSAAAQAGDGGRDSPAGGRSGAFAGAGGASGRAGANDRAGAGSGDGPDAGTRTDAATPSPDAGMRTRPFLLASAGTQLLVDGPNLGLQLTRANLADDVDVVAIHQEFYGVPWQAFIDGTAPPAEWLAKMEQLAADAHAIGDVFLSVNMLNGSRETAAERTAIENGQVKHQDNWTTRCYDFASAPDAAQLRTAYVRYVERMIELFEPRYLNFAVEVNLFLEKCPDAAAGVVQLANAAYAAAKAKDPDLIAFPSFQIDHLYGVADDSCPDGMDEDTCFDRNYAQIVDFERDRFAMSSYPFLQGRTLADLPSDWFERGAARGGERALIAETGWLSTDLVAQRGFDCVTVVDSDEDASLRYLERVLQDAERVPLELVTWWSNRDLLPAGLMTNCPCDYSATWCSVVDVFRGAAGGPLVPNADFLGEVLMKAFGTMGIRDYDGVPKARHAALWNAARER